jgi:hypothetical protein
MNREYVSVKEFKVGDIVELNSGPYELIKNMSGPLIISFWCRHVNSGDMRIIDYYIESSAKRFRYIKQNRTCAPCYDSDCDCIYDMVR